MCTSKIIRCMRCGKRVKIKARCKQKSSYDNPYPEYSYNSGLIYDDGRPVYGRDIRWMFYEIEHGRLIKNNF